MQVPEDKKKTPQWRKRLVAASAGLSLAVGGVYYATRENGDSPKDRIANKNAKERRAVDYRNRQEAIVDLHEAMSLADRLDEKAQPPLGLYEAVKMMFYCFGREELPEPQKFSEAQEVFARFERCATENNPTPYGVPDFKSWSDPLKAARQVGWAHLKELVEPHMAEMQRAREHPVYKDLSQAR